MNNEKFNNYDVFHAFLVENADYRESDYIEVIDCIMSRDNDYIMF